MTFHKARLALFRFARRHPLAAVGALIVIGFILTGIFANQLAPMDPNRVSAINALTAPNATYLLGADNNGRDVLSRIIFGARMSLYISITAVGIAAVIGVMLGVCAAWYRAARAPIMRLMDVMLAFPGIVTALAVIAILGRGVENVILAVAIVQIPQFARLAQGLAMSVKEEVYIEAALATGQRDLLVLSRHVLPNILAPLIIQVSLLIPSAIMTAAGLSFVGLGVPPPTAEWGAMLNLSLTWGRIAPHMTIFPGIALVLVVLGFNVLGDGLRDAFDPRARKR